MSETFTDYDIHDLLHDQPRILVWQCAIDKVVKAGDVVVDARAGAGVLPMLAVKAGATMVYGIEANERFATDVAPEHARRNGMQDRIRIMHGDAAQVDLPEGVDVIIADFHSTGMLGEAPAPTIANLSRFLNPGGQILPLRMCHNVQLMAAQEEVYGLRFPGNRWVDLPGDRVLSTRAKYHETDFRDIGSLAADIKTDVSVRGLRHAGADSVRISSWVELAHGFTNGEPTEAAWLPQTISLEVPEAIRPGHDYQVAIQYAVGAQPRDASFSITPL